ncbi:MAG TPA: tetratricopeptide repeat protein [Planctomycetota bacterium]|nr:tetratricopeptide repeat protein [Planctomycetota bacterium]
MSEQVIEGGSGVADRGSRELWGAWGMRWQMPLFVVAVLAWAVFLWLAGRREVAKREDPETAAKTVAEAFGLGQDDLVVRKAVGFAQVYPGHRRRGEVELYAGRSALRLADADEERRELHYGRAAGFARHALASELDDNEAWTGLWVLARSYMGLGDYREVLAVLEGRDEQLTRGNGDLLLLKARALFRVGQLAEGQKTIGEYLGRAQASDSEKVDGHLEAAEGYRLNDRLEEAEQSYRHVMSAFPRSRRIKDAHFGLAMTVMGRAKGDPALLDEAQREFESALRVPVLQADLDRQASFYIGECLQEKKEYAAAAEQLAKVAVTYGGTEEGVAAGLRLAGILVRQKQFDGAREALGRVLAEVPADGRLANRYVSDVEIRSTWEAVLRHFLSEGEYGELERLNRDTRKVAGDDVYLYQQAVVYRHWAQRLAEESDALRGQGLTVEAAETTGEARRNYRRAADLLVRIVNGVESDVKLYGLALQHAADSLYEAGDYPKAIVYYELLLKSMGDREDVQGLHVKHARTLQALGRHEEAVKKLEECATKYESSLPSVYEARFARTESYIALGDLDNAERSLSEIVYHGDVFSPTGKLWRRALTELGYVLYCRGKYRDAAEKLDEALGREGVVEASRFSRTVVTYYLADAYRNIGSVEPGARRAELLRAAGHFAEVNRQADRAAASGALEEQLTRKSRLAEADCRYELGEYAVALGLYESAAEKDLDSAEGVQALFGVAVSLHQLGETARAREAADRARWGLDRLKREQGSEVTAYLEDSCNATVVWDASDLEP